MEDDAGLGTIELWLNRTLNHSKLAVEYGATGLMGIHWRTAEVAPQVSGLAKFPWNHSLTSLDAWGLFFAAEIGEGVAERAAQIFSAHADSYEMPRPDTWGGGSPGIDGPGEIRDQCPGNSSWEPPLSRYDFIEQFHALRTQITDPGALSRFDLWDAHVQVARHQTLVGCDWNTLEWCIDGIPAENSSAAAARAAAAKKCLPSRVKLIDSTALLVNALLASVGSAGTIGSVQNLMQHTFPLMLGLTQTQLESALGEPLPPAALPPTEFTGVERLFVYTARLRAEKARSLQVKGVLLSQRVVSAAATPTLHHRPMGSSGAWTNVTMRPKMAGRGVFLATIGAAAMRGAVEYYLSCELPGSTLVWPATAPAVPHTVVVAAAVER